MRLLLCLAERAGEVVSIDTLLDEAWADVTVAPDSVYQAVTSLRRVLGDDPKQPKYIETVPRLGYRLVATVEPWTETSNGQRDLGPSAAASDSPAQERKKATSKSRANFAWMAGALICLTLVMGIVYYRKFANGRHATSSVAAAQSENSVAVLPFLDLTDAMSEEPFADGMTEELIDKLTKIPGLRVPPPTSSFYYKGKLWPRSNGKPQMSITEIAKALGVVYVLDGSVRKAGTRVRVDSRLTRADSGYVVWSQTYDRPFDDLLMVQDEIADEVAKALRASIEARPQQ